MIEFYLPFPPTVNNYYVKTQRGMFISHKGRKYRTDVEEAIHQQIGAMNLAGKLFLEVVLWMPDNRRRDVDNYTKSLLDALTKAGVWEDDSQIDQLHLYRGQTIKGGAVFIRINEAGPVIPEGITPQ